MEGGKGLTLLAGRINDTIQRCMQVPEFAAHANALGQALAQVGAATKAAWSTGEPTDALANAVPYLQAFGHTVLAWVWLDVALAATLPPNRMHAPDAWPPCVSSSITSCRKSAPGCRW